MQRRYSPGIETMGERSSPADVDRDDRHVARCPSPIGDLLLVASSRGLCGLYVEGMANAPQVEPTWRWCEERFGAVRRQLEAYFTGGLTAFDLPLDLAGSPFQLEVWAALREIPYGGTTSYAELARRVGRPGAARAVGAANGANPVSIVVPCHRVVGADGSLTGYGWGLERKRFLLDLESTPQLLLGR